MLVYKEHILLEARIEVRLEPEFTDDGIMVTVDVRINTIHALENLAHKRGEGLGERYTFQIVSCMRMYQGQHDLPILLGRTCSLSMLA